MDRGSKEAKEQESYERDIGISPEENRYLHIAKYRHFHLDERLSFEKEGFSKWIWGIWTLEGDG